MRCDFRRIHPGKCRKPSQRNKSRVYVSRTHNTSRCADRLLDGNDIRRRRMHWIVSERVHCAMARGVERDQTALPLPALRTFDCVAREHSGAQLVDVAR